MQTLLKHAGKRASIFLLALTTPFASAFAAQGPGASEGTASPEMQEWFAATLVAAVVAIAVLNIVSQWRGK